MTKREHPAENPLALAHDSPAGEIDPIRLLLALIAPIPIARLRRGPLRTRAVRVARWRPGTIRPWLGRLAGPRRSA